MSLKKAGGLRGFLNKVTSSASKAWSVSSPWGFLAYTKLTYTGFLISTSLFVTLIPLIMEIDREGQSLKLEKLQVNDFKSKGYTDNQLIQMGFSETALYNPSVL
ncbi:hypothetical protein TrVE_jg3032 [Triparma verrucosa]|uniref:Uncharacterized protein n=2 Tax=Triparma TaxID=722752 RepID=A0A9W7EN05_9STRA|nr:hypothetical protein TrST_g568 [Triparma strigata]GMH98912.1 hypothetical protein TrVE_jg3032 [Triparma verrucosa]